MSCGKKNCCLDDAVSQVLERLAHLELELSILKSGKECEPVQMLPVDHEVFIGEGP